MMFKLLVITLCLSSLTASAQKEVACAKLEKACTAEGYKAGAKTKRLWIDCVTPLANGKEVQKVSVKGVTPAELTACKDSLK